MRFTVLLPARAQKVPQNIPAMGSLGTCRGRYVFVTAADCQHPLGHYGEYGVGEVTGVSMINETLGEPPDNSKTVFGFAKQDNAAVGTYFVGVELAITLRVLLEPGPFPDVSRLLKGRNSICFVLHCVLIRPCSPVF